MSDVFSRVQQALEPLTDPARAAAMSAGMRGQFSFLGIKTPARREAVKDILQPIKTFDRDFVTACFQAAAREYQYVACDHIKSVGITDLPFAQSLVQTKPWWDSVDALAKPPSGASHDDAAMRSWAVQENFWVHRVAIIHQLGRKNQTDREQIAWIINQNLGSKEFFINKAIGWALRGLARHDPSWARSLPRARNWRR